MTEYSPMQKVKRRFFAMRNGIIADTLRRGGHPCRMIFGLNLPQISEIAAETGPSKALALELWADRRTRESLLMAPMIYPAGEMTPETALEWMRQVSVAEVADILCHRLFAPATLCFRTGPRGVCRRRPHGALHSPAPDAQYTQPRQCPGDTPLRPGRARPRREPDTRSLPQYSR